MKTLSALEVRYLVEEMQMLVGGRIDQIYQPLPGELEVQLHVANKGKFVLKVSTPKLAFLSSRRDVPVDVTGLCSLLRKKLKNERISAVSQPAFERIIRIDFSLEKKFSLIFELFSKGNIILLQDGVIVAAQSPQTWSSRRVAPKENYVLPPSATNPLTLDEKALSGLLSKTEKHDLVRFLALELSLGGLYAEELAVRMGVEKSAKPQSLDAKMLLKELKKFLTQPANPQLVKGVDATPFPVTKYPATTAALSFSEALDSLYWETKPVSSVHDESLKKLQAILDQQVKAVLAAQEAVEEETKKAEAIYNNYQHLQQLLDEIRELKKQGGYREVKKLIGQKKILSLDEKKGSVVVEL